MLASFDIPPKPVILIVMEEKLANPQRLPVEGEKSFIHSSALADETGSYRVTAARERRAKLLSEINAGWTEESERVLSAIADQFGLKS